MIDLDDLEAKAKAAIEARKELHKSPHRSPHLNGPLILAMNDAEDELAMAANPSTVLALVGMVREAQDCLDSARSYLDEGPAALALRDDINVLLAKLEAP